LEKYPENPVAKMIKENLYVDNVMLLHNDPEKSLGFCLEAKRIFEDAGFNLREFASNNWPAMQKLSPADRLTGMVSGQIVKVMGIRWDTFHDKLMIQMPKPIPKEEYPITRRKFLATISTPFDPLGNFSPLLLEAKNLLQQLWEKSEKDGAKGRSKKRWDEPLDAESNIRLIEYIRQICREINFIKLQSTFCALYL
jgi:hypothetical protein